MRVGRRGFWTSWEMGTDVGDGSLLLNSVSATAEKGFSCQKGKIKISILAAPAHCPEAAQLPLFRKEKQGGRQVYRERHLH